MAGRTIGEMTPEERRAVVRQAAAQLQKELDRAAPAIGKALEISSQDETPIVVIFRKWYRKADGSGIIALFPEDVNRSGMCQSYEHVGQHGAADLAGVISRTKPASPEEYAALKRELETPPFNYRLDVRKRTPRKRGEQS